MNKILVIEEKKFKEQLGCFNLAEPDGNFVEEEDIFKALENSKLNVIEFKGKAEKPMPTADPHRLEVCCDNAFTGLELSLDDFEWGESVQVLVVKPKKPEVSK